MSNSEKIKRKDAKERIFETATNLFARKSYSSVGVREIATEAEVNISMISYYFGGKIGILKAIIEEYFTKIEAILSNSFLNDVDIEENVVTFFRTFVNFIRYNTNLCMVWFSEANNEIPEIADYRLKKGRLLHEIGFLIHRKIGFDTQRDSNIIKILGPAILNMIYSHFAHKPVQQEMINADFNDGFYTEYADTLSSLFLNGVKGVLAERKRI